MTRWMLMLALVALAGCGSSDGDGGSGGAGGTGGATGGGGAADANGGGGMGGGASSGGAECGDHGHACMYGGKCHDAPSGRQDICEQQGGMWLNGNCPRESSVGCCISMVPGVPGATLIDYYYSPAQTTENARPQCGGEFRAP